MLGRRTYEIFAAHWPYITDDPTADILNRARKYVASSTLERVDWNNSVLLSQDVPRQVAELKQQDGPEIQVSGSATLIQALLRHNLIDEFRIWTFPVLVGDGKRLFGTGTMPAGLTLSESRTSSTGVVMSTYQPAGDIPLGSFALEEPTAAEVARRQRLAEE